MEIEITSRVLAAPDNVITFFFKGEPGMHGVTPEQQYTCGVDDLKAIEFQEGWLTLHYKDASEPNTFELIHARPLEVGGMVVPIANLRGLELVEPEPEPTPERWSSRLPAHMRGLSEADI